MTFVNRPDGAQIFYKDWGTGARRSCSAMAGR